MLISTVQSGPQHERVTMSLVEPKIDGLSIVSSMEQWKLNMQAVLLDYNYTAQTELEV